MRKCFLTEVCALLSASEEQRRHKLPRIPKFPPNPGPLCALSESLLPFFDWHASILSDKIEFSFVFFSRGSLQLTTMVSTSDVRIPVFKKIYPPSDIVSTNASILTFMLM
jgi:hypothetical protein